MDHQEEIIEQVDTNTYKCPECGAPMRYDPTTSTLLCDYCNRIINLSKETNDEEEDFFKVGADDLSWQKETQIIKCVNCGSENVVSKKEMSTTCPFCGSKQVVAYDAIAGIKPNRVIPFKLSLEDAKTLYKKTIKKKIFVPNKVKKMYLELVLNGVYIPSWTYDSSTFSTYSGRLGKRYTVVVGSGKNRRTETRIRWYSIRGTKIVDFDDILVNSGKSLSQSDLNSISPYQTNDSLEFEEGYLAGFQAEHYSKDVKTGFNDAKHVMDPRIRSAILSGYHYDVVGSLNIKTHYDKITFKYVLLPVWFGILNYHKKMYRFLINGESGKIKAKYPKSIVKILTLIFGIIIGIVLLMYLVSNYG